MFNVLLGEVSAIRTIAQRNAAALKIDLAFDAGEISFDEHEELYSLSNSVRVSDAPVKG